MANCNGVKTKTMNLVGRFKPAPGGFPSLPVFIGIIAGSISAISSASLLNIPAPEVLPVGGFSISTEMRGFMDYQAKSTAGLPKMRTGFTAGYGFLDFLEAGITVYAGDAKFHLASGQIRGRLIKEGNIIPAISIGCLDITGAKHPVEYSGFPVTVSEYNRASENNSYYLVARKGVRYSGIFTPGWGREYSRGTGPRTASFTGRSAEWKLICRVRLSCWRR